MSRLIYLLALLFSLAHPAPGQAPRFQRNEIYIVDDSADRILRSRRDQLLIAPFADYSGSGSGTETALAFWRSELLLVEHDRNRITAFAADGSSRVLLDAGDGLDGPWGLAADGQDNLYVSLFNTHQIVMYPADGSGMVVLADRSDLVWQPRQLVASLGGHVYAIFGPGRVVHIDPAGQVSRHNLAQRFSINGQVDGITLEESAGRAMKRKKPFWVHASFDTRAAIRADPNLQGSRYPGVNQFGSFQAISRDHDAIYHITPAGHIKFHEPPIAGTIQTLLPGGFVGTATALAVAPGNPAPGRYYQFSGRPAYELHEIDPQTGIARRYGKLSRFVNTTTFGRDDAVGVVASTTDQVIVLSEAKLWFVDGDLSRGSSVGAAVEDFSLGPRGEIVLSKGRFVYKVEEGQQRLTLLAGSTSLLSPVTDPVMDENGEVFVASPSSMILHITADGVVSEFDDLCGTSCRILSLALPNNGDLYALASGGGLYRYPRRRAADRQFLGRVVPAGRISFDPDSNQLLHYSDELLNVLDPDTGALQNQIQLVPGCCDPWVSQVHDPAVGPFRRVYGAATAGTGNVPPAVNLSGTPALGAGVTVHLARFVGGAPAVLFASLGAASQPAFGGVLAVDLTTPTAVFPLTTDGIPTAAGDGHADLAGAIVSLPALAGTDLYLQALAVDAAAPRGVSMSNGLRVKVGS